MPLDQRLAVLDGLSGTPALVDLDHTSQITELRHIQGNKLQINTVVSHHDYTKTPADAELESLANTMLLWKPTILKIAMMCQTELDAVRLLKLQLDLKAHNQRHIILGMGEHGVVTRIFGTLWGNELIFVPNSHKEASAPGQLTRNQLNDITRAIKG
jgi:3-dehydroquinate dehydratase type I